MPHPRTLNPENALSVKELAEAVRSNACLLTLKLARNKVNDVGAWELAEALKANRTLTLLDLTRNSVEEAGEFTRSTDDARNGYIYIYILCACTWM